MIDLVHRVSSASIVKLQNSVDKELIIIAKRFQAEKSNRNEDGVGRRKTKWEFHRNFRRQ